MAATTRAFHTVSRWSTTAEAASAASFQPSNAAITTGRTSAGVSSISITLVERSASMREIAGRVGRAR